MRLGFTGFSQRFETVGEFPERGFASGVSLVEGYDPGVEFDLFEGVFGLFFEIQLPEAFSDDPGAVEIRHCEEDPEILSGFGCSLEVGVACDQRKDFPEVGQVGPAEEQVAERIRRDEADFEQRKGKFVSAGLLQFFPGPLQEEGFLEEAGDRIDRKLLPGLLPFLQKRQLVSGPVSDDFQHPERFRGDVQEGNGFDGDDPERLLAGVPDRDRDEGRGDAFPVFSAFRGGTGRCEKILEDDELARGQGPAERTFLQGDLLPAGIGTDGFGEYPSVPVFLVKACRLDFREPFESRQEGLSQTVHVREVDRPCDVVECADGFGLEQEPFLQFQQGCFEGLDLAGARSFLLPLQFQLPSGVVGLAALVVPEVSDHHAGKEKDRGPEKREFLGKETRQTVPVEQDAVIGEEGHDGCRRAVYEAVAAGYEQDDDLERVESGPDETVHSQIPTKESPDKKKAARAFGQGKPPGVSFSDFEQIRLLSR